MVENSPANEGDKGDMRHSGASGRPPGAGNSNPLQYTCVENPMDRGALWATDHENEEKLDTTERLNDSNKISSKFLSPVLL